jgi:hypothetical protein
MNRLLALPLFALSTIAAASAAIASPYNCNLPRALLCEDCARALSITLTPDGACRITFTPGDQTSSSTQSLPLHFEAPTPAPRFWRQRIAWKPRTAPAPGGKCISFSGNHYCE